MNIRRAEAEDYNSFCHLMNQLHKTHHLGVPDFYKEEMDKYSVEEYDEEIKQENIYLIEDENEIVGFSYHNIVDIKGNPAIIDQSFMYIIDICIEQEFKHNGYGTLLFNELKKIAKNRKCKSIKLDVYNFNNEAILFYKKMNLISEKIGMSINV